MPAGHGLADAEQPQQRIVGIQFQQREHGFLAVEPEQSVKPVKSFQPEQCFQRQQYVSSRAIHQLD